MTESERRPLASRQTSWARGISRRLAASRVTPNQVSRVSMLMALIAGASLAASAEFDGLARAGWLVLAALGIQGRLLCNLFDGMIAIESGPGVADRRPVERGAGSPSRMPWCWWVWDLPSMPQPSAGRRQRWPY